MSDQQTKDRTGVLKRLATAGYPRPEDIAFIRPNSYDNLTLPCQLNAAPALEPFLAEVTCAEQAIIGRWPRRIMLVKAADDTASLTIRLHNFNAGMRRALAPGKRVYIYGQLTEASSGVHLFRTTMEMVHPRFLPAEAPLPRTLTPVYPSISRLTPGRVGQYVARAVEFVTAQHTPLPHRVRQLTATLPLAESLRLLHTPEPGDLAHQEETAIRSLKFDEWLAHIMLQKHQKMQLKRRPAASIPSQPGDVDTFAAQFEFSLTKSQRLAMAEIANDLALAHAMRRLLHGEVGCGKTLVAAYACWLVAKSHKRCAIMCPTVILASQHFTRLKPVFARLGINCVMLLGSTRGKERKEALATVANYADTVIIGTHTLFQEKTRLPDLALAVIDEQHRFGVAQRKALERKGGGAHVLMLSATPIPRTLVLGMLSHLDVTRITERPQKGGIRTLLFAAERANEVLWQILEKDLQAYWICPLIKHSDSLNLRAAEEEFKRICQLVPGINATLLHGKMNNNEKLAAMRSFETGAIQLLIATTVVEVGVDAPEADVIVIDHGERLGLSQLHQLRGRVGRGNKTGFCALLYEKDLSTAALNRLQAMHTSTDGFEIARQDLLLRGPGDIIGKRQSGTPKYRFAKLDDDADLLQMATKVARDMLKTETATAVEHVKLWLGSSRATARKKPGRH